MISNYRAVLAIYKFEMNRFRRTWLTGLLVPAITTFLYLIVFGGVIGSSMTQIDGIPYVAFMVPGLVMMAILTESVFNASFGIYMPKFTGTIFELLSAPLSALESMVPYVAAAATKALVVALVIFLTAYLFADVHVKHPLAMMSFMVLAAVTFSLLGLILGILARSFEQLQVIPALIIAPLTFLGGAFYSINMLGEPWQTINLFNPILYLISGFRWTFFGRGDVAIELSIIFIIVMMFLCLFIVRWIFKTGYRLKK